MFGLLSPCRQPPCCRVRITCCIGSTWCDWLACRQPSCCQLHMHAAVCHALPLSAHPNCLPLCSALACALLSAVCDCLSMLLTACFTCLAAVLSANETSEAESLVQDILDAALNVSSCGLLSSLCVWSELSCGGMKYRTLWTLR